MESTFEQFENNNNNPQRSENLKILCVLSFIMCGLMILTGIYNIYQMQPEVMQQQVEQLREVYPVMANQLEDSMLAMQDNAYLKLTPYLSIGYYLLSLFGVILMWNLKRKGFYIYAIAEILPYFGFVFGGSEQMKLVGGGMVTGNTIMAATVMMIAIDLIFVFLYSKEIKNMEQ